MTSLVSHMTCFMVSPHPQCKSPTKNEPILSTISTSISSQDDYSFLCTKAERHLSLLFGDDIATVKEDHHYRILFQNVNSLEMSIGQHALEQLRNIHLLPRRNQYSLETSSWRIHSSQHHKAPLKALTYYYFRNRLTLEKNI